MRFGKDTRPGMLSDCSNSAMCVQRFNDSLSCAIRITYRSSQRSSSLYEPRDPPLKVVAFNQSIVIKYIQNKCTNHTLVVYQSIYSFQSCKKINIKNQFHIIHGRQYNKDGCTLMILPQVHLRKPCYDFSFL